MSDRCFTMLLPEDLGRKLWKNGGGMTTEVAKIGQELGDHSRGR